MGSTVGCAASRLEERIVTLEQQVTNLQRDQQLAASRLEESDRMSQNMYLLQDRVEQMSLLVERMQSGVPEAQGEVPGDVAVPEPAPQTGSAPVLDMPKAAVSQASKPAGEDAVTLYRKGYDKLKTADYKGSAQVFRQLVEQYPAHELADNALYWLGEVDYAQKNYRQALETFRKVIETYPSGNKAPDAMLKLGFCQQFLGEKAKAKETLQNLIKQFPWSDPARKAKDRLQVLG
jgi:tol-pal system protein YbgF